jgi:hypothetical protein
MLAEAVRQPAFCIPRTRESAEMPLFQMNIPELGMMRSYLKCFATRARYRIASGDIDGAMDDIISAARLGRRLEQAGTFSEHAIGYACEAVAFAIGPGSSLEHQPTAEQWQRFLNELNDLPARGPASAPQEIERLALLDAVQTLAAANGDMEAITSFEPATRTMNEVLQRRDFALDWNVIMRRANENFSSILLGTHPAAPEPEVFQEFMSRGERSSLLADLFTSQYVPAIDQFHEIRHRTECKENLLRITVAMLLYEKEHGALPPAYTVDEQGLPLHSWRVLLLPYLGYDELYAQLRLDEPWDSPHNQAFQATDVPVFQCPSAGLVAGMTEYSVVEGETCAVFGSEGQRLDVFGEHSAAMILVVERVDPVCWMDPTQELTFAEACLGINRDGVGTGLGSHHTSGMHIGLRSGGIRFISQNIDRQDIPALLEGTMQEPF